ncbi:MAG: Regulator of chromosome condensation [Candidatus Uhrbacteria bacterium GW2011_GWC2_41_11]|uniref:Regulator of chromosome condensation n=1 Tax=Candidatus Uhrbacteria bacterium GW2011_GWC2_41_11 TaxID=1618985 RepID=A0A0G0XH76_9BACT|nr:MAG: Regulator of chromosome condensation [Candidatus Uhrbacteria bacterium GW2011_GWC2_41_11]
MKLSNWIGFGWVLVAGLFGGCVVDTQSDERSLTGGNDDVTQISGDDDSSATTPVESGDDDASITTPVSGDDDSSASTGDDDTASGDDDATSGDDDSTSGDDDDATVTNGDDDSSATATPVSGDDDSTDSGDDDATVANPTQTPVPATPTPVVQTPTPTSTPVTPTPTPYPDSDSDGDGYDIRSDCDDSNISVHPGATEVCDGKDNDCDGSVDEDVKDNYYRDADVDGYGTTSSTTQACSVPTGYAVNSLDCDDSDASVHPGAVEQCNGEDDDCDGVVDENVSEISWYQDADKDGYGNKSGTAKVSCSQTSGYVADHSDCDDSNSSIYPGATETSNGKDDDCDGVIDEGTTSTPTATEETASTCRDGVDNDKDGAVDADDEDCMVFLSGTSIYISSLVFECTPESTIDDCIAAKSTYVDGNAYLVGDGPFAWGELLQENYLKQSSSGYFTFDFSEVSGGNYSGTDFTLVSEWSDDNVSVKADTDGQSDWRWAIYHYWCADTESDLCYRNSDGSYDLRVDITEGVATPAGNM